MANILLEVPLQAIPNQMVSSVLNGQQFSVKVYLQNNYMYSDIYLNNQLIVAGNLANHAGYINQYPTPATGYFFWFCDDGLNPTFEQLGKTAHLMYANYDALAIDEAIFIAAEITPVDPRTGIGSLLILQNPEGLGFLLVDPDDDTKVLGIRWT